MKLPAELDSLMWSVAESGDRSAIDQFGERYPHLRAELGKRLAMVRQLRGAKPETTGFSSVPRFENRQPAPSPTPFGRPAMVAAAFVLVVIASAAFVITKNLSSSKAQPTAVETVSDKPAELPNPPVVYKQPAQPPPQQPTPQNLATNDETKDPAQTPQTVKLNGVKLSTALKAVAMSGGLQLEIAPNLDDQIVRIDYRGYAPLEILQDMGQRFGFSAFDNGPHRVLIIPARDKSGTHRPIIGSADLDGDGATPKTNPEGPIPTKKVENDGGPTKKPSDHGDKPSNSSGKNPKHAVPSTTGTGGRSPIN